VPALGLGCMSLSIPSSNGHTDEDSLKLLTAAADMGMTFWVVSPPTKPFQVAQQQPFPAHGAPNLTHGQTSDWYGPHHNEEVIGRWFKETGRRKEIFLCTKFGHRKVDGQPQVSGKASTVKEACEASLKRLNTDYIDLYAQHRVDPDTPIEEAIHAMVTLKEQGKIRHLGLSECSARTLRRACAVHPIATAEMEFSPFALEIESAETKFLATARELGVKIIAYSPLGRGFLTGRLKSRADFDPLDKRIMFPRFAEENFADNLKIVAIFEEMAREKGCSSGQVALAWVLAQGDGESFSGFASHLCAWAFPS
jgi:aryl-alcohol dehydrogenase-like predicted oxidoreductase